MVLIDFVRRINGLVRPDKTAQRLLTKVVSSAARYASRVLLDVGCGSKPYRRSFDVHVENYFGLDPTKNFRKGMTLSKPIKIHNIIKKLIGYLPRKPPMPDIIRIKPRLSP